MSSPMNTRRSAANLSGPLPRRSTRPSTASCRCWAMRRHPRTGTALRRPPAHAPKQGRANAAMQPPGPCRMRHRIASNSRGAITQRLRRFTRDRMGLAQFQTNGQGRLATRRRRRGRAAGRGRTGRQTAISAGNDSISERNLNRTRRLAEGNRGFSREVDERAPAHAQVSSTAVTEPAGKPHFSAG